MSGPKRHILVTGANGFIGKNLCVRLSELPNTQILKFSRDTGADELSHMVAKSDAVVHLAGENRPEDTAAFMEVNYGLTKKLCNAIVADHEATGRTIPVVLSSSAQAALDNPYGSSKLAAEKAVQDLAKTKAASVTIFRLPGVFGKWCKPNYNSVVATFCHNIARDLPIQVNNPDAVLTLTYIDDVVSELITAIETPVDGYRKESVQPEYTVSLGELADKVRTYQSSRGALEIDRVGTGLQRALYATYVSYLPTERFVYDIPQHTDERGAFVEMLKTVDSGQFSFFSAAPGITRGGHYHHTKTEKFLVIRGEASFRFRQILTDERVEIRTSGETSQVVETIPGWSHDVTNVGEQEMLVMLWANEVFDRDQPDTIYSKV